MNAAAVPVEEEEGVEEEGEGAAEGAAEEGPRSKFAPLVYSTLYDPPNPPSLLARLLHVAHRTRAHTLSVGRLQP